MIAELSPAMQQIAALTPATVALVVLAGFVVGLAPSSVPLISVATGLALGDGTDGARRTRLHGLRLSIGFVLGIVTVDILLGMLFGLFGFAVLRLLVSYLPIAYLIFAALMIVIALALLRVIHVTLPSVAPRLRAVNGIAGSYALGLPFGLSTCPACTPLLLPVVGAAAASGSPLLGAVLMGAFGLARGIPVVFAATTAGSIAQLARVRRLTLWVERIGAALMVAAAAYFLREAAFYAGWLS